MKWIIDRFEESDVLNIGINKDETKRRKAKADKLLDELFGGQEKI